MIDFRKLKEHTNRIVSHCIDFNASYRSMENMARVINATPNSSMRVPETKYKIKQLIKPNQTSELHIKCSKCYNYLPSLSNEIECTICGTSTKTSNSSYFIYIPIEQQLKESVIANIDEILSYYLKVKNEHEITDIHNAKIFVDTHKKYPNAILLPLIINTDGVKVYRSQTKSLWLILFYQCYLKPSNRYKPSNVLMIASHFGNKKPDMKTFFYPFLKQMREIQDKGGFYITHKEIKHQFMPLIIGACCDLPAKAELQGMTGHSGRFACGYCLHPGIPIKENDDKKSVIRYTKSSNDDQLRSHNNIIQVYRELHSKPINGIKSVSCMVAASQFDLVNGFVIDPMHCVYLGVVKKLVHLWLDSKYHLKPFYISKKNQVILSNRLVKLKPPSEIMRRPRSLFSRNDFKANEFRGLLLYFMRFALVGLHDMKYIRHFQLFCSSIYSLSKETVSEINIQNAHVNLNEFADNFEILYGKSNITINLHLIRHLTTVVKNLGPLWAYTAFGFEAKNGIIAKANTCTNNILQQLAWKYTIKLNRNNIGENIGEFSINGKKILRLHPKDLDYIGFDELREQNFLTIYKSAVIHGTKFTSLECKDISTIDYFVKLKNGVFGTINFYIIFDNNLYASLNIYDIIDIFDHFNEIKCSGNKALVKVIDFERKVMYLKFGVREFVTMIANRYEKS